MWPYHEESFTNRPSSRCYEAALNNRVKEYGRVEQNLEEMKACLAEGYPFVFGFAVFSSFMSAEVARTGVMPFPQSWEQFLGGHAVQACGYDEERRVFIVRNSWGESWGDR